MRLLTRLALAGRRWQQWIALVQSLKVYTRADFSSDLSAGVVVGMVTVPQAVAYAYLAGLPPQAGLYALGKALWLLLAERVLEFHHPLKYKMFFYYFFLIFLQ